MGLLIYARCKCGYKNQDVYFGHSEEDKGQCFVPALKNGSSEIEMINIVEEKNHSEYTFYTDNILYEGEMETYHSVGNYKLNQFNNLCPNCKQYTMEFLIGGWY